MSYKRGQERLRSSLLGDGLLERARNTSLALLGLTTAVGLTMVALALNQGWPLIAGSPIPQVPPRHQGVGEATIAAGVESVSRTVSPSASPQPGRGAAGGARSRDDSPAPNSQPTTEFVVSPSTPVEPQAGDTGGGAEQNTPPADQPPRQVSAVAAPTPSTQPDPPSAPQSNSESTPPGAVTAEAPVEEPDESSSGGQGRAAAHDDDRDWGDDDRDWDHDRDWDDDHDWDHDRDWDDDHDRDWDRGRDWDRD